MNRTLVHPSMTDPATDGFFPVIVIGAGHAGCEAALASARLGVETLLLTMNLNTIALMPCNPSIGGPGKGHLVREIGVLGGEMAANIDEACIQVKWLNTSRGPAVRARRAQADKAAYRDRMTRILFTTPRLQVRQAHVVHVLVRDDRVVGVQSETGLRFGCDGLVLATGTSLDAHIILGFRRWPGGPHNQPPATGLSDSLTALGIRLRRLQTATPPRIHRRSIDVFSLRELPGDRLAGGFLWENRVRAYDDQVSCYLTCTNAGTIEVVRRHLPKSPLMLKNITHVGPKHCPSIDRKVMKFPDQVSHQIFIEPEGRTSEELYVQGLTTGMPPEAQRDIVRSIPGMEHAEILRFGYAIEYDAMQPGSIRKTMASRRLDGLFTAGQINGTSGYEEAAAQGLIAGINAARRVLGRSPYIPSRTDSYLGVLVDDLAMWDRPEPYRITPGHAEFRLHLRDDSAERRLSATGMSLGLLPASRGKPIREWVERVEKEIERLRNLVLTPTEEVRSRLERSGTGTIKKQVSAADLLARPGIRYEDLSAVIPGFSPELTARDEMEAVEHDIAYSGYAAREEERRVETRFLESLALPLDISSDARMKGLGEPARAALARTDIDDVAQLVRKNCLSRADLAMLMGLFNQADIGLAGQET